MHCLISTSRSLLLWDSETGRHRPLHQGAGLYYGMAATPDRYLVAARHRMVSSPVPPWDERGEILVFDPSLRQVDTWRAPFPLRDIHEIAWGEGRLWVSCSFDNLIALRHPDGRWESWYPLGEPRGEPRDRNHFNSFALGPQALWIVAHNRGASEVLEFTLPDRGLRRRWYFGQQAHNLWQHGGRWHTCSSIEGCVIGQDGRRIPVGGFTRGVARLASGWLIGVSQLAERAQRDWTDGQLVQFDEHWRERARHGLPGEGLVLDLLALGPGTGPAFARPRPTWPTPDRKPLGPPTSSRLRRAAPLKPCGRLPPAPRTRVSNHTQSVQRNNRKPAPV
jgi:hypothetical protein